MYLRDTLGQSGRASHHDLLIRHRFNRWPSGRVSASAYCGYWCDLQQLRSRCALLIRPDKVETAVQCSACRCLPGFLVSVILCYIRGHSISLQNFLYNHKNCRRHLKIQYVIAIYLIRWLTHFYDFRFNWTATAAVGIHPTKSWLSQLVNFKNAIWTWEH